MRDREFNNEIKNGYTKFKTFPGSDSREILHCGNPSLESGNYDSTVLHFGDNDLMQKVRSKSDTTEYLIKNKRKAAVKYISHGVSKVFVPAIVRNKKIPELAAFEEVNKKISFMCKNNNFIFVDNSIISNIHLFDDILQLVESGYNIMLIMSLINNITDLINKLLFTHFHHPSIYVHTLQ